MSQKRRRKGENQRQQQQQQHSMLDHNDEVTILDCINSSKRGACNIGQLVAALIELKYTADNADSIQFD